MLNLKSEHLNHIEAEFTTKIPAEPCVSINDDSERTAASRDLPSDS